jgi:hypothetical protein
VINYIRRREFGPEQQGEEQSNYFKKLDHELEQARR